MLHTVETKAMTVATRNCLRRNDRAVIRAICNVNARDEFTCSPDTLLSKLGIQELHMVIRTNRMGWFWHEGWIA